jgi:hypothetical protein
VGGVIELAGDHIQIDSPYLTVAGHSAPAPGITIIDGALLARETHDTVISNNMVSEGLAWATHPSGSTWCSPRHSKETFTC